MITPLRHGLLLLPTAATAARHLCISTKHLGVHLLLLLLGGIVQFAYTYDVPLHCGVIGTEAESGLKVLQRTLVVVQSQLGTTTPIPCLTVAMCMRAEEQGERRRGTSEWRDQESEW